MIKKFKKKYFNLVFGSLCLLIVVIGALIWAFIKKESLVSPLIVAAFTNLTLYQTVKNQKNASSTTYQNFIFDMIKQNKAILDNHNKEVENLVRDIKTICCKENTTYYLFIENLIKYKVSNTEKLKIKHLKLNKFIASFISQDINNFLVTGELKQIEKIALWYMFKYENNTYKLLKGKDNLKKTVEKTLPTDKENLEIFEENRVLDFLNINYQDAKSNQTYSYDTIFNQVNFLFKKKHSQTDFLFRHIHRIVKMINEIENKEIQKNLLGILRAQYSNDIVMAIYFNCIFTSNGIGLAIELLSEDFFGDINDFHINNLSMHTDFDSLYLSNKHKKILTDFFINKVTYDEKNSRKYKILKQKFQQSFDNEK